MQGNLIQFNFNTATYYFMPKATDSEKNQQKIIKFYLRFWINIKKQNVSKHLLLGRGVASGVDGVASVNPAPDWPPHNWQVNVFYIHFQLCLFIIADLYIFVKLILALVVDLGLALAIDMQLVNYVVV